MDGVPWHSICDHQAVVIDGEATNVKAVSPVRNLFASATHREEKNTTEHDRTMPMVPSTRLELHVYVMDSCRSKRQATLLVQPRPGLGRL